ncbi:beta strand repeat-containing protein, partial [Hansschlegelia beijingensis]|uniref:beta strand repeat-containing protein n=1 Tax=Hansschlegelia beijingensis TaxID=1133344 RepID=UPI00387F09FE
MSRLINPMVLSIVFTVEAGFFGSAALAQQYMGYDDTLSGSYNYTISGRPGFAVEQLGSVTDATPLSLTSSGASVTFTNPSASTAQGVIGGIYQSTLGNGGDKGEPPGAGTPTGSITTNLSLLDMELAFTPGSIPMNAVFGLYVQTHGGTGGDSTSHDYSGAPGSAAGVVDLTLSNSTISVNTNAQTPKGAAVFVEQIGGAGGAGYHDQSAGLGGGSGPATIKVTDSTISAKGDHMGGLVARQTGGAAGVADGDDNDNSNGAIGGSGNALTITLAQGSGDGNVISTAGSTASGVSAVAAGGNGSTGGDDGIGVSINVTPGNGGDGGNAGHAAGLTAVSVTTTGLLAITTTGSDSSGIEAKAQGGKGGNGGEARGTGITPSAAGAGGRGDSVSVSVGAGATIKTSGSSSSAVLASAKGGQGGMSGTVDAVGTFSQGQPGGAGGAAELVTVSADAGVTLTTSGDSSNGITALSIGGDAGDAGAITAGLGDGHGGDGGRGGDSGGVAVTSGATIDTSGATARGILVQAMSGAGG